MTRHSKPQHESTLGPAKPLNLRQRRFVDAYMQQRHTGGDRGGFRPRLGPGDCLPIANKR